jgi:formylmethanofuran dehydrogenase subunit C
VQIRIEHVSARFDLLGAGATAGDLLLEGDADRWAGRSMRGGALPRLVRRFGSVARFLPGVGSCTIASISV